MIKRFRSGQTIVTKDSPKLKPEYRKKAGVIVSVHPNYLSVKFHRMHDSAVLKEDVAEVL